MKVLLLFLALVSTVYSCWPSNYSRTVRVSVHRFRVFDPKFVVTPKQSRPQVIRNIKENVGRLIASYLGVPQGDKSVGALGLSLESISFLTCADILPLSDTTPTGLANVNGSYYCLQANGMIGGICHGANCNRVAMEPFPEETIGWNFPATLSLRDLRAKQVWNGKDIRDVNNYVSRMASASTPMFKNVNINFS